MRLCFAVLVMTATIFACRTYDPLYCDEETTCEDPERPFCDLAGEFPASEGHARTCIADPRCEPGDFLECDGDLIRTCGQDGIAVDEATCDLGCNEIAGACNECAPGRFSCVGSVEVGCGEDGKFLDDRSCSLGCDEDDERCVDIEPSNDLVEYLDQSSQGPDLILMDGATIDTNTGTVFSGGRTLEVPTALMSAPDDGVAMRVFMVKSLRVEGTVDVDGAPAIAFVSSGDIIIDDVIRIDGDGLIPGPGAGLDGHGGGYMSAESLDRPGGSGGGFGRGGAPGGDGEVPAAEGGAVVGNAELVPLRGGGNGGSSHDGAGAGGGGGGAIQLVSRTIIAVNAGGGIDAGGGAGTATASNVRGGGAGGGILLEAPVVLVSGVDAILAANGGGGGCRGTITSAPQEGLLSDEPAKGCVSSNSADGGDGSAKTAFAAFGEDVEDTAGNDVAGGGGGGTGRIRINNSSASFTATDGAIISPAATVGEIHLR